MNTREEEIQTIFEKFENIFKSIHRNRATGMRARHEQHRAFHREHKFPFDDLNLSRKQVIFLFLIAKSKDGITSKDLSIFFWISPGAVTQFIDVLIEKNLVIREEDPDDRRVIRIKLTDYAKSKFTSFRKAYVNSIAPIFDNLTDDELKQFIKLLDKLQVSAETKTKL